LIAYLRALARLPMYTTQEVLAALCRLRLSAGAIMSGLGRLARATAEECATVLACAWASTVAHIDETGWREDGQNSYAQRALRAPVPLTPPQRAALVQRLEQVAHRLGQRYAGAARQGHPCHTLCHHLLRHQGELFAFVRVDGLSADSTLAERDLRPLDIAR